jgi:hypothetical protein
MSKIYIYASEIATIINKNPYDVLGGFNRIVNKFAKENIVKVKEDLVKEQVFITESIKELASKPQTKQVVREQQVLEKKSTVIKHKESNIEKSTITDQQKVQKIIPNYVPDMKLAPKVQKQELRKEIEKSGVKVEEKLIDNFINKSYGTKREDSSIEMFQKKFNVVLDTSQKFYSYHIDINTEKTKHDYYIGGKMDGVYKNEYIVEVKNRMRGFFPCLKDYEKCQIYTYMLMTGINHVKLVECFNNKIKTTSVSLETDYKDELLGALEIFIKALDSFLQSDLINDFLVMNDIDKTKFIHVLYLNKIQDFYNENTESDSSSVECMFE